MRSPRTFLTLLFGTVPAELFVLLWTLPDKRSCFFPGNRLTEAAHYAADRARACDAYVAGGLRGRDFGHHQRGTAGDVVAIPGLWADLDLVKPSGTKPYFPTREALTTFLDTLPLRPTLRVWTGGGVHA